MITEVLLWSMLGVGLGVLTAPYVYGRERMAEFYEKLAALGVQPWQAVAVYAGLAALMGLVLWAAQGLS